MQAAEKILHVRPGILGWLKSWANWNPGLTGILGRQGSLSWARIESTYDFSRFLRNDEKVHHIPCSGWILQIFIEFPDKNVFKEDATVYTTP